MKTKRTLLWSVGCAGLGSIAGILRSFSKALSAPPNPAGHSNDNRKNFLMNEDTLRWSVAGVGVLAYLVFLPWGLYGLVTAGELQWGEVMLRVLGVALGIGGGYLAFREGAKGDREWEEYQIDTDQKCREALKRKRS